MVKKGHAPEQIINKLYTSVITQVRLKHNRRRRELDRAKSAE